MQKELRTPALAGASLFSAFAFALPLAIQSAPTFSSNLSLEKNIGLFIFLGLVICAQTLISRSAKELGRRVSYYRIIPLLYWPLGAAFAIMHLWENARIPKPRVENQRNLFLSAIAGKEPLSIAIVGTFIPTQLLAALFLSKLTTNLGSPFDLLLLLVLWCALILASVLSSIAVWRCAGNAEEVIWTWLTRLHISLSWMFAIYRVASHYHA